MEKRKKIKVITILTILCGLITIFSIFSDHLLKLYLTYKFNMDFKNASSIGIIGGADGPTAIFLSGRLSFPLINAIFPLLTILGIVYLFAIKGNIESK